jgi:hypothetical protein
MEGMGRIQNGHLTTMLFSRWGILSFRWMTQRFSAGRLRGWPRAAGTTVRLAARELQVLLWNGYPDQAAMAEDWRRVA